MAGGIITIAADFSAACSPVHSCAASSPAPPTSVAATPTAAWAALGGGAELDTDGVVTLNRSARRLRRLVRSIAQKHGGSAVCTARDGGGACFLINLPG